MTVSATRVSGSIVHFSMIDTGRIDVSMLLHGTNQHQAKSLWKKRMLTIFVVSGKEGITGSDSTWLASSIKPINLLSYWVLTG